MIDAENGVQLLRRPAKNVLRGLVLRVCLRIDLAQILVELGERELDGGLHSVNENRREVRVGNTSGHAELVAEHELHELGKHAVLGAENVLERTVGDIRLPHDLGNRRFLVPLFQKQLDTYGKNPSFCGQTGTRDNDSNHILSGKDAVSIPLEFRKSNIKRAAFPKKDSAAVIKTKRRCRRKRKWLSR